MVLTDSNGIQWFVASGQQGKTGQSRNTSSDKRWSGNVSGVSQYGYEVTCYGTFNGTASGDESHFALKHWGPNHSGDCGHEESGSCCCWYDTGIRGNGDVQLQTERPHPSNHDFTLQAGTQQFISNIGTGMEGKTIGLKWLVYPKIPGGTANNGGIQLKMWVDTSGFNAQGRPQNQWRLVYSVVDTGQILGNYQAPDEHDIENRVSDTDSAVFYAGGQHWRKLIVGDAARDDGNTNPPPPPPTGGTANNIDPFGIKMIYPTKQGGQTWFQNDNPEFDGRLVSDLEIITKVGDYFLASGETDTPGGATGGTRLLRVLTEWGDFGRMSCDPNESNWSNFDSQGHIFTADDWKNVEITGVFYPQDLDPGGDPGSPTGRDFDIGFQARASFPETEGQTGCCGRFRYAGAILATNTGDTIGKVRFNKNVAEVSFRTENFSQTVKPNGFFRTWTGFKFIIYNVLGENNETWVTLEIWLCPSDSSTDLSTNWTKVASYVDKGDNWGSGGQNCNGTDKQAFTWGSPYVALNYDRIPELRWKKWSVREIDINASFPPDDPGPGPGPDPDPDPCEEEQQQQQQQQQQTTELPTYKFLSWGDNDTTSNARAVLDRMFTETDVSQYLFAGDGPYSTNASNWIDMMSEYFSTQALKEKLMLAQGNHEHPESESQTAENQIEAWFPGLHNPVEGLEWLRAKKVGNVYIIVMNSQDPDIDEIGSVQYNWVANELNKAKLMRANGQIDWIITMVHKSWFNLLGSNPAYVTARHAYAQIFRDAQVDFMFHGHNHSYAIWRPIIDIPGNDENTAAQHLFTLTGDGRYDMSGDTGTFYIINGNGGHEINNWGEDPADFPNILYANDDDFGYTRLVIKGKQATISAIKVDGTVLFSVGATRGVDQNTPPAPTPLGTVGGVNLQSAANFIKNQYNSTLQMVEEAPSFNVFWLWSDQLLAQIILKHVDPSMATTIENKMNSFGVEMKNLWSTLDPQYRSKFSVGAPTEPTIQTGPPAIRYSHYGGSPLSVNDYADVAFLSAIHHFYNGNLTLAKQAYDAGRAFWDGTGMDDAGSITGDYANYKAALGLLAEKVTGFTPSIGIPANYFQQFQNANGGITTDLTGGVPDGSQNIETTVAVMLALNPGLLSDPTNPPSPNPPPPDPDPCAPPPPPPPPESVYNDMIIVYNINSDSDGCICNAPPFTPPPPGEEPTPPPPTGGGGSGGENQSIYDIRHTRNGADSQRMASESGEEHYYLQFGAWIRGDESPLLGKNIKRIEWPLKKSGNPKGPVSVVIRKGTDNTIAKNFGSINAEDLTTSTEYKGFENTVDSYTTVIGDRILVEYDGGDDNDYVIAWAVGVLENDTKVTKRDNTMSFGTYRDRNQEAAFRAFA